MTLLLTDMAFTAFAALVVVLMVATVLFFVYDTVVTFLKGNI